MPNIEQTLYSKRKISRGSFSSGALDSDADEPYYMRFHDGRQAVEPAEAYNFVSDCWGTTAGLGVKDNEMEEFISWARRF
jgi:hypothetical protein